MENKLKVEYIDIDTIKPYKNNAKLHPKEQIEQIKKSIENFGMNDPIGIWKNEIVEGHGRILACKELGYKQIPVIKLDHLTDEERKSYIIAHNKLTMNSDFDIDILRTELENLKELDFDLDLTGFDTSELDEILDSELEEQEIIEDEVPEVPEEPKAKLGDIYQLGNHRLMCGDSTKKEDVLKLINNNTIDFVYTDPPYGINLDGDNSKRGGESSIMKGGLKLKSFIDDSTSYAINAFNIVQNLKIKKQVWWGANYYCHSIPETNNWLIWDKRVEDKMTNTNSDCELAWVLDGHNSCRIYRYLWNGLIKASENGEKRVHPTQKPIALADWCYKKYAPEAINIMDLFGGSGSSLIMAEQNKLKMFMMEYDPHYVDVIIQRWENFTGKKAVKLN